MNTDEQPNPTEWPATIKLGNDAHAKWFVSVSAAHLADRGDYGQDAWHEEANPEGMAAIGVSIRAWK